MLQYDTTLNKYDLRFKVSTHDSEHKRQQKSLILESVYRDPINVWRKQKWTKDSAPWDTRQTQSPFLFFFIEQNGYLGWFRKKKIHFNIFSIVPYPN